VSAIALDPLIAEAKRRARRRWLLAVAAIAVAGAAIAGYSISHGGRPSAVTPRVSIPAGATGVGCGVRGVGVRILGTDGQTLYREPGYHTYPNRGFPAIQCSGSTIWATWFNGAGMMQEAYLGARSLDRGRTWKLIFTEGMYGPKAPHHLDSYLGVWTLRGRNAYFVGSCPACSVRGIGVTNALFVTKNGGRTFARHDVPALTGYIVTGIRVRGDDVIFRAKRLLRNVGPPRKTVTIHTA